MTNWRAMQVVGALKWNQKLGPMPGPGDVKPRSLSMGSWKCNLSKTGIKK